MPIIVMAIIGGAVFTPLMGLIAEAARSIAIAMLVPLVGYVFIAYYAFVASKTRMPETVSASQQGIATAHRCEPEMRQK